MSVYGSATTCSGSAHDPGTTTPTPGAVYVCRKCGAHVVTGAGPEQQFGAYPGAVTEPVAR